MIPLRINTLSPDPVQYKPYSPVFTAPEDCQIIVEVPVFEDDVQVEPSENGTDYILNLAGFKELLITIASTIDAAHTGRAREQSRRTF